MKKIILFLIVILAMSGNAHAENVTNFWKLQGTVLSPLKSTWSLNIAGGITFGASTMAGALNMANYNINDVGIMFVDADNNSGIGSVSDNTITFYSNGTAYMSLNNNTLTFLGGSPTIKTTSNTPLFFTPNGTGITKFGDAMTTALSVADNDDVLVTGGLEVGESIFTGGMTLATNRGDVPVMDFSVTNASADGTAQSIPIQIDGQFIGAFYAESDGAGSIDGKEFRAVAIRSYGRIQGKQGTDVASANDLTLTAGNFFNVTGTTTINGIATAGWQAGSTVTLSFADAITVKHDTAPSAGFAKILLGGSGDFSANANDNLTLTYNGTTWNETGRTEI